MQNGWGGIKFQIKLETNGNVEDQYAYHKNEKYSGFFSDVWIFTIILVGKMNMQ